MTHTLIESTLPIFFEALCFPAEWSVQLMKRGTSLKQLSSIEAEPVCRVRKLVDIGSAIPYDPWEKRNEFFRLQEGDTKGLLHFLASVGFLEHPQLTKRLDGEGRCWLFTSDKDFKELKYVSDTAEARIWRLRRQLQSSLASLSEYSGKGNDFRAHIASAKDGSPQVILTTTTFLDAIHLTLLVDKAQDAKVQRCARPDCGIAFSVAGGRKRRYCSWYCGHIESVRRSRKKVRKHVEMPGNKQVAKRRKK